MHKSSTKYNILWVYPFNFFLKNMIIVLTGTMKIKRWLQPEVSIPSTSSFSLFDGHVKILLEEQKRHRILAQKIDIGTPKGRE